MSRQASSIFVNLALAGMGCAGSAVPDVSEPGLDLSAPVPVGEARAGVIDAEQELFAGVSADGRLGDVLMVNDRVRFVIQSTRDNGSFFVGSGGGVIDADIVRPAGEPGRDILDEIVPMYGSGRVLEPTSVEVISDGQDGGAAVVQVRGIEAPMALIEGAVESTGLLPTLALDVVTTYTLQPDSWLLEVHSEVMARGDEVRVEVGDLVMGSADVAWQWNQGTGLREQDQDAYDWNGYVGHRQDVAVMVMGAHETQLGGGALQLLSELADMTVAFGPQVTLAPGESTTWTRYYGVGPDVATLTDEVLTRREIPLKELTGEVTADDGPVAGAWVHVLVDGRPYTLASSDAEGRFEVRVPEGVDHEILAVGQTTGLFQDLAAGAAPYGPYGPADERAATLTALTAGTAHPRVIEGRGVGTEEAPLVLGVPAEVVVDAGDGLPFYVELVSLDGESATDSRLVPPRARGGRAAAAWSRDGDVSVLAAPGRYRLLATRGIRHEVDTQEITLVAGQPLTVSVELTEAYRVPGWLLGDPHSHASPSGDASVTMEGRLLGSAAMGVQVHFGTDHDHVADYRPLVAALGLEDAVTSIVADEVSPPLRGHFNVYPLEPKVEEANHGAWRWWESFPSSTEDIFDKLADRHGSDIVVAVNHPTDNGMASMAGWSEGSVRSGDRWSERFSAMEVLNAGSIDDYLDVWWDLTTRGVISTPVGVSDAHGPFSGRLGLSATYLGVGVDSPAALTDALLLDAVQSGRVVVTRGPFLSLSVDPGSTLTPDTTVEVEALSPSWIVVDRLLLFRDGVEVSRVDGTTATFQLAPEADAVYTVVAEGDTPMAPVDDQRPWAMSGALFVDVDGDGWTPPAPPLAVGER